MRHAWIVPLAGILGLAACSADVAPGTYFCGPEESCPEGQACNGIDNICTTPSSVLPFRCDTTDPTDDDSPATGLELTNLACVSGVREIKACLVDGDPGDWVQFDVPGNCNGVRILARLSFPIAWEPPALQISTDGSEPVAADTPCDNPSTLTAGQDIRCFEQVVENGSHHAVGVVHSGVDDCDGNCAHNRYTLSVQLVAP